jgi:hypothetical protein
MQARRYGSGGPHEIQRIGCGQTRVWSRVCKAKPPWVLESTARCLVKSPKQGRHGKVSPAVGAHGARTTRVTVRYADSNRVARARRERTRKGRPVRRGNHGRHGGGSARCLWPLARWGLGTGGWFTSLRCTWAHARAQRHMRGNGWRARVWVRSGAADRRRMARLCGWGGVGLRWSAHAITRMGVRAQERPGARAIWVER